MILIKKASIDSRSFQSCSVGLGSALCESHWNLFSSCLYSACFVHMGMPVMLEQRGLYKTFVTKLETNNFLYISDSLQIINWFDWIRHRSNYSNSSSGGSGRRFNWERLTDLTDLLTFKCVIHLASRSPSVIITMPHYQAQLIPMTIRWLF